MDSLISQIVVTEPPSAYCFGKKRTLDSGLQNIFCPEK